jgi:hypothetical protein
MLMKPFPFVPYLVRSVRRYIDNNFFPYFLQLDLHNLMLKIFPIFIWVVFIFDI